jgi:hypothetical protein
MEGLGALGPSNGNRGRHEYLPLAGEYAFEVTGHRLIEFRKQVV